MVTITNSKKKKKKALFFFQKFQWKFYDCTYCFILGDIFNFDPINMDGLYQRPIVVSKDIITFMWTTDECWGGLSTMEQITLNSKKENGYWAGKYKRLLLYIISFNLSNYPWASNYFSPVREKNWWSKDGKELLQSHNTNRWWIWDSNSMPSLFLNCYMTLLPLHLFLLILLNGLFFFYHSTRFIAKLSRGYRDFI